MKKAIIRALSLLMVCMLMLGMSVVSNATDNAIPGDVNHDGEYTIFDALFIVKAVVNGTELENSDVNGDGKTNLLDVVTIIRFIATGEIPEVGDSEKGTADVVVENGTVKEAVSINGEKVSAAVPEGVAVEDGTTELTLSVTALGNSNGNITTDETDEVVTYDVHIDGVSEENQVAIIVDLGAILPTGQNTGTVELYHIENGVTVAMTQVMTLDELDEHNEFYYYPATGNVYVAMATFSEVVVLSDSENAWDGTADDTWYDSTKTELTIANANQLWSFSQIVGGMADGIAQDTFKGKTIKLAADINIGDTTDENGRVFYPIGYYNTLKSYDKVSGVTVTSNVYSFEGTFDGTGHTVKNFYQNTWEMFGDYGTSNYYKDAMGLFGYVYNGTVKNLTVENFSSDGEFTPTGVIAAFAENSTFENIAIVNCNPRVYNTGNGGIIGIAGDDDNTSDMKIVLKNITVDNSNTISALWGSWDVGCGGLVGMLCGHGKVDISNCHVTAKIDVYNDVCGNYQYYQYRYSGMLIGTVDVTDANGKQPDMSGISVTDSTVHFDRWNDYYYCELVANTLASYTHDHQFSRLTEVKSVDVNNMQATLLDGTVVDIAESGIYNFVVVEGAPVYEEGNATCYHFKKENGELVQHFHKDAGYETTDIDRDGIVDSDVLKEDKQCVYLPFDQLFSGYGWGAEHIPCANFDGVKINDKTDSVYKFSSRDKTVMNNTDFKIGNLFAAIADADPAINDAAVTVSVSPVGDSEVTATVTRPASAKSWEDITVRFSGAGLVKLTIQDYELCTPTTITVTVLDRATNHIHSDGKSHLVYTDTDGDGKYILECELCTSNDIYSEPIEKPVIYLNSTPSDNKAITSGTTEKGATMNANTSNTATGDEMHPVSTLVEAVTRLKNSGGTIYFLSRVRVYNTGFHNHYSSENQFPKWEKEITLSSSPYGATGFRIENHGAIIGFNGPVKIEHFVINGATWNTESEEHSVANGYTGNNSDGKRYKIPVFVANWNDFTVGESVSGFGASYFVVGNYFRRDVDIPDGYDAVPDDMAVLDLGGDTVNVTLHRTVAHDITYSNSAWNEDATATYDRVYLGTRNRSNQAVTVKNVHINFVSEGASFNLFFAGNTGNRYNETKDGAIIETQMEGFTIDATFKGNARDAYINHFQTGGENCRVGTAYLDALNVRFEGSAYLNAPGEDNKDEATVDNADKGFLTYNVRDLDVYFSPFSDRLYTNTVDGKTYTARGLNERTPKFSVSQAYLAKYPERTETVYLEMGTHSFGYPDYCTDTVLYPQRNYDLYGAISSNNKRVSGKLIIECEYTNEEDTNHCVTCGRADNGGSISTMVSRFNMTKVTAE